MTFNINLQPAKSLFASLLATSLLIFAPMAVNAQDGLSDVIKAEVTKTVPASKQQHAEWLLNDILDDNQIPREKVQDIKLLPSEELNAATNGSSIVYSEGLWDLLVTDDQKAFVLAHELAHIQLNHIPKTTARRVGYTLIQRLLAAKFANSSPFWQQASQLGLGLTELKFSRSHEYGADDLGLSLMENAGYDPRAAVEVFNLFEKHSPDGTPEFLRSHPLSKSRIERLTREHTAFQNQTAPDAVYDEYQPTQQTQQFQQTRPYNYRINIK